MKIKSKAFKDGGEIPSKYTCDGQDISPPLSISDIPEEAETLALVVDDPDAPGSVFDHWLMWNIPADTTSLPENIPTQEKVESLKEAHQGKNDFGEIGYRGPCPPAGPSHNYRFKLYALNTSLDLDSGAKKSVLEKEMEDFIVEQDSIVGIYGR